MRLCHVRVLRYLFYNIKVSTNQNKARDLRDLARIMVILNFCSVIYQVSVFDSVVQGGDSVWEGLRVYKKKIFKLEEHLDRYVV